MVCKWYTSLCKKNFLPAQTLSASSGSYLKMGICARVEGGVCQTAYVSMHLWKTVSWLCGQAYAMRRKSALKRTKKKIHLLKVRAGARRSEIFRELQSSKLNSNMTSGPENYFPWEKAGSSSCETFKGSLFILKWHLWMNHFCHFSSEELWLWQRTKRLPVINRLLDDKQAISETE